MSNTPNYGWDTPDNTGLVRNGALDMRTLGNAIDTSVWNVGFGQAGKNKIINGNFSVNQRSFTTTSTTGYTFDRWYAIIVGASQTYTPQTFTPGTAPVAGYEGSTFLRMVTVGGASNLATINQRIEDVRTFAGQTMTLSFWAKAASGTPRIGLLTNQNFGSGGSSTVNVSDTFLTIGTSWARYSFTVAIPSIAGKTIGAGSYLEFQIQPNNAFWAVGQQTGTFDIWGVQAEAGNRATPFQTASGGSIQGELAMCQRYYYRATVSASGQRLAVTAVENTTTTDNLLQFPVTMRTNPTALEQSGTASDYSVRALGATTVANAVPTFLSASTTFGHFQMTVASGLTAGNAGSIRANSANAFLGWSAEL